jgi:hypothetical protein
MALAGACVVAAATAIGSFVMVSGTGSPGAATPAAARLLAQIANAAEQQSSPQVRDSEFMYIRSEWIFDQATLQFIGERDYDNNAHEVTGDTAILQEAFVSKAGQLPGR